MKKHYLALALGALLVLQLGCAHAREQGRTQTFVIAQTSEPRTLDPLLNTGYTAEQIGSLLYSFLLRIDSRGQLEPDLAQRVPSSANGDISSDGKTLVYHLRHGVRWQDGQPFTADDVVATFRAVMNARNPVPTRLGYDQVESIRALDALTLQVKLRKRFAPFLTYFFETETYPILPAHALEHIASLPGSIFDSAPIGTGPFRVVEWRRGDHLELDANNRYYAGAPKIRRLRIEFVPNPQTIVLRLQTGEADAYLAADPFVLTQLRAIGRLELSIVPIYGFISLSMQTRNPALRDPAVRRAIVHSFDFAHDIATASHNTMNTRDAFRSLFTWAYVPLAVPASSARLPTNMTLSIDGSRALDRTLAVIMQQEARRAGAALVIRTYAPQQFEATATDAGPLAAGNYELALHEVLTGADPETSWILGCSQIPPVGYNITRYCDSRVNAALDDALLSNDPQRRARDYAVVQDALAQDVPFFAIAQLREIEATPRGMRGFQPSLETPYYRAELWQL